MTRFPGQFQGVASRGEPLGYESQADSITVSQFFNMVYAWMCVGLALTAVVGWYFASSGLYRTIYASKGGYVFMALAAFGIAWYAQSQAGRLSVGVATGLFLLYAAVIGALLSGIFIVYQPRTLISAFVLTGGTFGAMSVYGFVTKRDLSRIGSIAVMAAFGFIIASFVNIWLQNDALGWVITYAILVLFIVITAWETQMLRNMAMQFGNNREMATRFAIMGSLVLYIAFINLFLSILRILGDRR
jgi:FtsH-binding integral membrane protein